MEIKQIIGIILIALIVFAYYKWLKSMRNQKGVRAVEEKGVQIFNITVEGVYSPAVIRAKAGMPVRINFTRKENTECSRFVKFPDLKIREELPEGKTVPIEFTPKAKGEYGFSCDMGMYQGKLIIE